MSTNTVTVLVPTRFWDDHIWRGCTAALETKTVGKKTRITLDRTGWDDLLSDSWFYIDLLAEDDMHMRALAVSAVWTFSALAKTEVPWEPIPEQAKWLQELPTWARPKNWAAWTGRGQ